MLYMPPILAVCQRGSKLASQRCQAGDCLSRSCPLGNRTPEIDSDKLAYIFAENSARVVYDLWLSTTYSCVRVKHAELEPFNLI